MADTDVDADQRLVDSRGREEGCEDVPPERSNAGRISSILGFPLWLIGMALNFSGRVITRALGGEVDQIYSNVGSRRFVEDFQKVYGQNGCPSFLSGTYREAVATATLTHKLLLVYLHSPLHEDTPQFCHSLASNTVVEFVDQNLCAWGGSIWHVDAHVVAKQLGAFRFPFTALLMCKPQEVHVLNRFQGNVTGEELLHRISASISRFQARIQRLRMDQEQREEARKLRDEQDLEYHQALQTDRARDLQETKNGENASLNEDAAIAQRFQEEAMEAEKASKQDKRERRLMDLQARVAPEVPNGVDSSCLRLQMPSGGGKIDRRFSKDTPLQDVANFVELYMMENDLAESDVGFTLTTNFPKQIFHSCHPEDMQKAISDLGMYPQSVIFVTTDE